MKKLLTLTLSLLMAFSLCLTVSAGSSEMAVSSSDGYEYGSLEAAINAAPTDTETTITLIKNDEITVSNELTINKDIVLNLNGKTLNVENQIIISGKTLKVKDSSGGNGKIYLYTFDHTDSDGHIKVAQAGEFILESGTLFNSCEKNGSAIIVNEDVSQSVNSKVTINGGYITSKEFCIGIMGKGATANVNDGTIISSTGKGVFKLLNYVDEKPITVTGGVFYPNVSEYLTGEYSVVEQKVGIYDAFKVVKEISTEEIDVSSKIILRTQGAAGYIKDKNGDPVTVNNSTEFVLNATKISKLEDSDTEKVVEQIGADKLPLLPLDITLTAINDGVSTQIAYLGDGSEIWVTLHLSEEAAKAFKDKTVKVVRIHDGIADVIEDQNVLLNGDVLKIKTGKFSTYVICGTSSSSGGNTDSDTSNTTSSTKSYSSKDKNQDGVISCEEEMDSANWIWSTTKNACVYKVSNTGVR